MLVRERDSIVNAVHTAWSRINAQMNEKLIADRKTVLDTFCASPAATELVATLKSVGISNAEEMTKMFIEGSIGGYGPRPAYSPASINAKYVAAITAIPNPVVSWGSDASYSTLSIALSTCKMKWPVLQVPVYLLVTDISAATSYDDIRAAIMAFTKSIS